MFMGIGEYTFIFRHASQATAVVERAVLRIASGLLVISSIILIMRGKR